MFNVENSFVNNMKYLCNILMGTVFIVLMTNVKIDWYPVSFTMQSFAIMMLGFVMSGKMAVSSVLLYLMLGIFSTVFTSKFCGIDVLFNTVTSGYLVGFLVSVYLSSKIENSKFMLKILISEVSIFVPGVLVLSNFIGIEAALYNGFIVFIIPEIMKISLLKILIKKYI